MNVRSSRNTLKLMTRERFDVPPLAICARWPQLLTAATRTYRSLCRAREAEAGTGQSAPSRARLPLDNVNRKQRRGYH